MILSTLFQRIYSPHIFQHHHYTIQPPCYFHLLPSIALSVTSPTVRQWRRFVASTTYFWWQTVPPSMSQVNFHHRHHRPRRRHLRLRHAMPKTPSLMKWREQLLQMRQLHPVLERSNGARTRIGTNFAWARRTHALSLPGRWVCVRLVRVRVEPGS